MLLFCERVCQIVNSLPRKVKERDSARWKKDGFGSSNQVFEGDLTDDSRVATVVSIVSHHENMPFLHDLSLECAGDGFKDEIFLNFHIVEVQKAIFDLNFVIFDPHNALNEVGFVSGVERWGPKDHDISADRIGDIIDKLIDQNEIVDVQGGLHGARGNIEAPHHKMYEQKRHHARPNDRIDGFGQFGLTHLAHGIQSGRLEMKDEPSDGEGKEQVNEKGFGHVTRYR